MRLHVAVAVGVEDAEFERVHPHRDRKLVHLAFEREVERCDAEAAHGGRRRAVGEDAVDVRVDVRNGVRSGNMGHAFDHRVAGKPRIGARVEISPHLAGHDTAVLHDAVLDVDALGAARRAVLHLFMAAKPVAHRRADQPRCKYDQRLGQRIDLAAETAANRAADEMQLVRLNRVDLGGRVEREKQRLR